MLKINTRYPKVIINILGFKILVMLWYSPKPQVKHCLMPPFVSGLVTIGNFGIVWSSVY